MNSKMKKATATMGFRVEVNKKDGSRKGRRDEASVSWKRKRKQGGRERAGNSGKSYGGERGGGRDRLGGRGRSARSLRTNPPKRRNWEPALLLGRGKEQREKGK